MGTLSISGVHLLIDGQVINEGRPAEGLALNARLVQAISDFSGQFAGWDEEANTTAFIAALDSYKAHGLNAITVNFQGGLSDASWGENFDNTAWTAAGALKAAYASRMTRALNAMVARDIIPIVGLFYFRQDQKLTNEAAVITAVDNAIAFLQPWKSQIVIEVINESSHGLVNHAILQPARVGELIARCRNAGYFASASMAPGAIPPVSWNPSVVLLHGNNRTPTQIQSMVSSARNRFGNRPIAFNEDGASGANDQYTPTQYINNLNAAITAGAGWGYYDQPTYQTATVPTINWSIRPSGSSRAVFDRFAELGGGTSEPPPTGEPGAWLEASRRVVIEAESIPPVGDWALQSSDAGHTGTGYFVQTGPATLNQAGNSVLEYRVKITNGGSYFTAMHTRRQGSGASDADNDCFYQWDSGPWIKHFQRAGQPGTTPSGSTASHEVWRWADRHEFPVGTNTDPVTNLAPGYHTLRISKRSQNYSIDRIHIFSVASGTPTLAANPALSTPESDREDDGGPTPPPVVVTPPTLAKTPETYRYGTGTPNGSFGTQRVIQRAQSAKDLLVTVGYDQPGANKISGGATTDGYVDLDLTEFVSTPDHASLDITGDFEVRALIEPDSWTPGSVQTIVSKWDPPTDRAWALQIDAPTARFRLLYDMGAGVSIVNSAAHGLTGSSKRWVRVLFDANTGSGTHSITFFVSTDGLNWQALGGNTSIAGTATLLSGAAPVYLGGDNLAGNYAGRIYAAEIRNGIGGTAVASPDFRTATQETGATFTDPQGRVWSLSAGATRVAPTGTGGMFWNGVPLTRLQGQSQSANSTEHWHLANPTVGTADLDIQFSTSIGQAFVVVREVAGSTGLGQRNTAIGVGPSPAVSLSAAAGSLVIGDHLADSAGTGSNPPSGWIESWDSALTTISGAGARRPTTAAGTVAYSASIASASWQAGVVEFLGTEGPSGTAMMPLALTMRATPSLSGFTFGGVYHSVYLNFYPVATTAAMPLAMTMFATPFVRGGTGATISLAMSMVAEPTVTGVVVPVPTPRPITYSVVVVARIPHANQEPDLVEVGPLLGWTGLSYEEVLSGEAGATVSVDPHAQPAAVRNRLADLVDASELWVYRGSEIVFAGPIVGLQPQAGGGGLVTTVQARSLWHYPRRWFINVGDTLTYTNADQFTIVRSLINYHQNLAHGDFGIEVVSGLSGVTRDRTYVGSENHNIGQRIEELSAVIDGFDFRIIPGTRQLLLGYPTLGTDRTDTVVIDRRNVVDPGAFMSVGPEDLASEAFGTSDALTAHRTNAAIRQRWGRVGAFQTFDGVTNQTTLNGHADEVLDARSEMFYQPGPNLIPVGGADVSDFSVGDTIEMVYDYGFSTLVTHRRVAARTISVSDTGDEAIAVQFTEHAPTQTQRIRSLERRVAELQARI